MSNNFKGLVSSLSALVTGSIEGNGIQLLQGILGLLSIMYEEEQKLFTKLEIQINLLVNADVKTAYEFLERAKISLTTERSPELIKEDLKLAQYHFTKALGVQTDKLAEAMIRHKIGICAISLSDISLARIEFEKAYELTNTWKQSLKVPQHITNELERQRSKMESIHHPKTLEDYVIRFFHPDIPSMRSIIVTFARLAEEDYEKAQKALEEKKIEANAFQDHLKSIALEIPDLKLNYKD